MRRLFVCAVLIWLLSQVLTSVAPEVRTGYLAGIVLGIFTVGAIAFIWGWNSHVESTYQSTVEAATKKRDQERK